jgi:hypothetical protein
MINELDLVVLTRDIPEEQLEAGDVGTVVGVYSNPPGYEIEFSTFTGETIVVVAVSADSVRPLESREITHARRIAHSKPSRKATCAQVC